MIVEDEIFVAMDIERVLADAGYHVVAIAADSIEALAAAPDVDLAFVNLNLHDGPTGPELARKMARAYGTKIVYATANPAQIGPAAETAVGFIRKPFRASAILSAVTIAAVDPSQPVDPDLTLIKG